MITSIPKNELIRYTCLQLNRMFPDRKRVLNKSLAASVDDALDRIEHCFCRISKCQYFSNKHVIFDHLYSDQYLMFLWFLANSSWRRNLSPSLFNKLYLLNKALHGFDCSFSTALPDIFIVVHGVGTVLGKAQYSDYLTVYQGCTVGQAHDKYPTLGQGVGLGAGVTVLGDSKLGNNVSVGSGCTLVNTIVDSGSSVYRSKSGHLEIKKTKSRAISKEYFLSGANVTSA